MIKRSLKDFNDNRKIYRAYVESNNTPCIKDLNKLNRLLWKLKLRRLRLIEDRDYSYRLTLKK